MNTLMSSFSEAIAEEDDDSAPSSLVFNQNTWTRRNFPAPTPLGGLPTITQSPYGSMSSLRQSQESLRASQEMRSSQEGGKYTIFHTTYKDSNWFCGKKVKGQG